MFKEAIRVESLSSFSVFPEDMVEEDTLLLVGLLSLSLLVGDVAGELNLVLLDEYRTVHKKLSSNFQ